MTVRNTGVEPIAVGVNPRTNEVRDADAGADPGQHRGGPAGGRRADAPVYLAPPDTSRLTVATTSTVPAQVELQGSAAGFDLFGDLKAAQHGATTSVATVGERNGYVSKGIWFGALQEIGPFGRRGRAAGPRDVHGVDADHRVRRARDVVDR